MADNLDIRILNDKISIHDRIKRDRDSLLIDGALSWTNVKTYRDYTNGIQGQVLTEKQKKILRNVLGNQFADNVCHQVVSSAVGRITFQGWTCSLAETKQWLDNFFLKSRIKYRQSDVNRRTLRDGNFAISLAFDPVDERVKLYKEDWWNGVSGLYIHYGDNDEAEYAVKEWAVIAGENRIISRRVVYFNDRIERYYSEGANGQWLPYMLPEDNGKSPVPLLDAEGNPLGIPIVHFPNAYKGYGSYGDSELAGGIIGFQDQVNDLQYQISIAARLTGAQQYYAAGIKLSKDKEGNITAPPVDAGTFHTTENENAKFGVLPAGDITKLIEAHKNKLQRIAQITATPIHNITGGDYPAAEALIRIELPSVQKAQQQIEVIGAAWISVAVMAAKLNNLYAEKFKLDKVDIDIEKAPIGAAFADPEKRDVVTMSIVVHNMQGHMSHAQAWRMLGKSESEAQDIAEEISAEAEEAANQMIKATLAGRSKGVGTPPSSSADKPDKEATRSTATNTPNNTKK